MESVTTNTRTLVCLAPKNRRKVVKCIHKQNGDANNEQIHDSQLKKSKEWSIREKQNQNNINNELYNRMQLLASKEFNQEDFKRREYDSYSLILYKTLITEINLQRRELKYLSLFGDKWRSTDEVFRIEKRINTSLSRIERLKNRERDFKEKYFQDSNYLIKGIDIM
tara:strand:+ start:1694 stop:2194 length:501 start_codon:yes stop_codon:yes gene_type:complete